MMYPNGDIYQGNWKNNEFWLKNHTFPLGNQCILAKKNLTFPLKSFWTWAQHLGPELFFCNQIILSPINSLGSLNKKNNSGTISFEYHDLDQLDKLINIIKNNY